MDATRPSSRRHFIHGSTAVAGLTIAAPAILRTVRANLIGCAFVVLTRPAKAWQWPSWMSGIGSG